MARPVLYYDLGSPYAYLAVERAERVLGVAPRLQPVLLGGIFGYRGRGSWAHTSERERNVAEIERRAAAYGLPPLTWPPGWPPNTLRAMRAATWADREGAGAEFAVAAFRRAFAGGADLGDLDVVAEVGRSVGLDERELRGAVEDPAIKRVLLEATQSAWAAGVAGVPCLRIGDQVAYGDDRLERAAAELL